jgi:hypothetical protein
VEYNSELQDHQYCAGDWKLIYSPALMVWLNSISPVVYAMYYQENKHNWLILYTVNAFFSLSNNFYNKITPTS